MNTVTLFSTLLNKLTTYFLSPLSLPMQMEKFKIIEMAQIHTPRKNQKKSSDLVHILM